jgi:hypothetical protein
MSMRLRLTLFMVSLLTACTPASSLFPGHVYDGAGAELVHAERAHCMHCPAYFEFRATQNVVEAIVAHHELVPIRSLPECLAAADTLGKRNLQWWKLPANVEIYGVCYTPIEDGYETQFRMLARAGNTAYFMTSLGFQPKHYKRIQ